MKRVWSAALAWTVVAFTSVGWSLFASAQDAPRTAVNITIKVPEDSHAPKLSLNFRTLENPANQPVLALIALDVAPPQYKRANAQQGQMATLAGIVTDADSHTEVWLGEDIKPGQETVDLEMDAPDLLERIPGKSTDFQIRIGQHDATLKRITQNTKLISLAQISDLRLVLPKHFSIVDSPEWKPTRATSSEYQYKGSTASGNIVTVIFRMDVPPLIDWLQEKIVPLSGFLLISLATVLTILNISIVHGFFVATKALFGLIAILFTAYILNELRDFGLVEFIEDKWLIICFLIPCVVSLIVPKQLVGEILKRLKDIPKAVG
jgi:hypothetical protein